MDRTDTNEPHAGWLDRRAALDEESAALASRAQLLGDPALAEIAKRMNDLARAFDEAIASTPAMTAGALAAQAVVLAHRLDLEVAGDDALGRSLRGILHSACDGGAPCTTHCSRLLGCDGVRKLFGQKILDKTF